MALQAGVMAVTIEFAKDLKDSDWFGKQDPYCIISVGGQTFRTKTAVDGGRNPVWNETFSYNVINDNAAEMVLKDEDVGRDDLLGTATVSFARAREHGSDRIQVPVVSKKSKKQHGFISVSLKWTPNKAPHQQPAAAPYPQYALQYAPQYAPMYAPPAPYMYPAQVPAYLPATQAPPAPQAPPTPLAPPVPAAPPAPGYFSYPGAPAAYPPPPPYSPHQELARGAGYYPAIQVAR